MKAFPHKRPVSNGEWCGMDLRDYFAAKVLSNTHINPFDELMQGEVKDIAKVCYIFADAMMEARK